MIVQKLKSGGGRNVGNHAVVYGRYEKKGNFALKGGPATLNSFTICRAYPLITTGIELKSPLI